jgi:hypothetical protein
LKAANDANDSNHTLKDILKLRTAKVADC